jgi:ABC-type transport system involved in multi-copper enzyme maturation permease subunit
VSENAQIADHESQMDGSADGQRGRPEREALAKRSLGRLWRFVSQTWNNPIVIKELRGRMRGWRAAAVLSVHLVILGCFASLIYFTVAESAQSSGGGAVGKTMGQTLFYSTYMLLLTVVVFLSPAFTAGTISGERERKTLDLLITTLLPARSVVIGKLASALAYIVLLILAALPIQSLALMFGGIILSEVIIGTLILLVTALIAGSIGIFVSSLVKSSIASTVLTYATILLTAIGLPIVAGIVASFLGTLLVPTLDEVDWLVQAGLIYVGGFLLCTNPFATAVATKVVEESENSLLFFTVQLTDRTGASHTIPLISPWVVYVILYVVVSALLITLSILIIRRKRG